MRTLRIFLSMICVAVCCCMSAQITMTFDATKRGPEVSPYQYGLFFEEINHAGDGGLYAELIRNRSFEDSDSNPDYWGTVSNSGASATISLVGSSLLNDIQNKALRINVTGASARAKAGVYNEGFWGMKFVQDSTYHLEFWAKTASTVINGKLYAQLQTSSGTVIGEALVDGTMTTDGWSKLTADIKAEKSVNYGRFAIVSARSGTFYIDVVSLFPYTWKGRKNGMRPDLAQLLYDTKPSFLRFPGGCYVEGLGGLENSFRWKNTIGPIEERPGHWNHNWGYRSSDGLGFDEYLQLCEDLEAAPLFVVNVGLGHGFTVPLADVDTMVQNTLDAIEYANGDASTYWGARRIANGRVEPYNLKFIEIGNENYQRDEGSQSADYAERYYKFYKAIKEAYPDIITIGNVEAWGTDNPSWRNDYPVEIVDEHYYRNYTWMRNNYHKYDSYSRTIKVYNGEYAANEGGTYGTYGNMNSALGEAIYMLGMENNSDVCYMASFAPIFTHESNAVWPYDMIHFNANGNFCTPSYYVQKLLGNNLGEQNILWTMSENLGDVKVGMGSWNTTVSYDDVKVYDSQGNVIIDDDFSGDDSQWTAGKGTWAVADGICQETASGTNYTFINNNVVNGNPYTLTLKARKDSGNEGFLIIFDYKDSDNYTWWNIGGWNNGSHGVETCVNGTKTTVASKSGSVATGQWYDIKIEVGEDSVKCYLDGELIHKYAKTYIETVYSSAQLNNNGEEMILKVVNPSETDKTINMNLVNMTAVSGTVVRLTDSDGLSENTMDNPYNVVPSDEQNITDLTTLDIPAYSLSIFRIKLKNVAEEIKEGFAEEYEEEDADKYGYLFAHMNASKEITNYALSKYGTIWTDLLDSEEVFDTKAFTTTGGMRDAYVMRTPNNNFLLAGTDMTSALGWDSNHAMVFMFSNDLVHWTKSIKVDIKDDVYTKALGVNANEIHAAWAPQIIYDKETGKYIVYYSIGINGVYKIYYSTMNEDLTEFSTPVEYFYPGTNVIDADIVWNAVDQKYVMTYKEETKRAIFQATAPKLTGSEWTVNDNFSVTEAGNIEAPSVFRMIGSNTWTLGYINYSGYGYRFRDLDEHCDNPTNRHNISGDVEAQHGSYVKLTEREYNYLKTWAEVKEELVSVTSMYELTGDENIGKAVEFAQSALANSGTFDEEESAMYEALEKLQQAYEDYKKAILAQAAEGQETDLTALIVNPDFNGNTGTGWLGTGFTQASSGVAEHFNKTFNFYQVLTDMPAGTYEFRMQAFYRAGSIETAYESHTDGTEPLNATIYMNDATATVMSLYDSDKYTYSPYTYPDNVWSANSAFNNDGEYWNTITAYMPAGDITIGIRLDDYITANWCCFDNFQIRYLGPADGIEAVEAVAGKDKANSAIYDMTGRKVGNAGDATRLNKGVYIIGGKKVLKK